MSQQYSAPLKKKKKTMPTQLKDESESFSRLDLDIDEATTDGIEKNLQQQRQEEMTRSYFEIKIENGGLYDQIAVGITTD